MSFQTNSWIPDTCLCKVEYTWDDSVLEAKREHILSKFNQTCSYHASLGLDDATLYALICYENMSKNHSIAVAMETFPQYTDITIDKAGNKTIEWKPGYDINVQTDDKGVPLRSADGIVTVVPVGFDSADQPTLEQAMISNLGQGVVEVG